MEINPSAVTLAGVLVSTAISFVTARIVALRTTKNTVFTVRAQVRTAYRVRWLEEFRGCISQLLFLGQQIHSPLSETMSDIADDRRELRKCAAKLLVLLGRERSGQGQTPRYELGDLIRSYARSPSPNDEQAIEALVQLVFRDRWDQISHETGVL